MLLRKEGLAHVVEDHVGLVLRCIDRNVPSLVVANSLTVGGSSVSAFDVAIGCSPKPRDRMGVELAASSGSHSRSRSERRRIALALAGGAERGNGAAEWCR